MAGRAVSSAWSRPGDAAHGSYGTLPHVQHGKPMDEVEGGLFLPGKRRRLNWVGIVLSALLPPCLFWYEMAVMSSGYRYTNAREALELCMVGPVVLWGLAVAWSRSRVDDREPMWMGFQLLSCFLAVGGGILAGAYLYNHYMLAYFDLMSLNEYPDVDPSSQEGDSLLDAGFIGFADGTKLQTRMISSYKMGDQFCAVPIVNANVDDGVPSIGTYDYWAVGKNCCGDPLGVFRCGQFLNSHAQSGLRVVDSVAREGYMLAVKQAEAKYNITATYPVFVTWCQNPLEFALELASEGQVAERIFLGVAFVLNAFMLAAAVGFFSRIGRF